MRAIARFCPILLLIAAGTSAQTPLGTLVDVGGYRVHVYCTGTGSPTVAIIGGFSFDWALVQPEVAKFTRVCTYDASGNAWSDRGPEPTCMGRVDEIHRLLAGARIDPPYVLAGFSAGALFARLYAKEYPDELSALALIDHAYSPPPAGPLPVVSGPDTPPVLIFATPVEIDVGDEPGFEKLPAFARELHRWAMPRHPVKPDAVIVDQCVSAIGNSTLGNLPLVVVSTANDAPGYADLQRNLLALSSRSTQFIAAESFHSIEISQPDVVIRALRLAVEESRK